MPDPNPVDYAALPTPPNSVLKEQGIEEAFIQKLVTGKSHYRTDIRDRAALEANFREKFEALNRVRLTDADCPARQRPPTTRSHPAESERGGGQFASLLVEILAPLRSGLQLRRQFVCVSQAPQYALRGLGPRYRAGVCAVSRPEKRVRGIRFERAKRARMVGLWRKQPNQSKATTRHH